MTQLPATLPPISIGGVTLTFPEAIDSTMLSLYASCPQKFFYEFVLRRVPSATSIHLHAGGAFAMAMEQIRLRVFGEGKTITESLEEVFPMFLTYWGNFHCPSNSQKDIINVWGAIDRYFRHWVPFQDDLTPILIEGKPAVEFVFGMPLRAHHPHTGNPLIFAGRADMIAERAGVNYIVDDKTTAQMGSFWMKQWPMRGQFFGYTAAARETGINPAGVIVRGVKIAKREYEFQEVPVLITQDMVERWRMNAERRTMRMVEDYLHMVDCLFDAIDENTQLQEAHAAWEYNFGEACTGYGGCQFVDLCRSRNPWDTYMNTFVERVWNPIKKDPTEDSPRPKWEEFDELQMPEIY